VGARRLMAMAWGTGQRYVDYAGHDSVPVLRRVRAPVLAVYGADDRSVPTAESARILAGALSTGGNTAYTIRFFGGAGHGLRTAGGGFADGYLPTMTGWLLALPATARPPGGQQVAGAAPGQRYLTPRIPPAPWFATGSVRLLAAVLIVAGFGACLFACWFARSAPAPASDPRTWPPIRRGLRWLAWTGISLHLAPVLLIAVIVAFLATGGAPPLVTTVLWLAARLLAVASVVLGVDVADRAVLARRGGWSPTGPQWTALTGTAAAAVLVWPFAAYSGLL
jgi:hypothetical protein